MITLDTAALEKTDSKHGLSKAEQESASGKIPAFLGKIKARNQGFYYDEVLKDSGLVESMLKYAASVRGKYDFIVLLGIGGSALGPIALQTAFGKLYEKSKPELIVLDNIDPDMIAEAESHINLKKTLFLVVSKSGGTPETLSQYFYFAERVRKAALELKNHFVYLTDPKKGLLREEADKHGAPSFPIPANVGGRFSILTSVGLLPAALLGIDIKKLLAGAIEMRERFLSEIFSENLPFQIATIQYLLLQKGKSQNVLYPYSQKLYRIGDWCRQLIAESTGKRFSEDGKEINAGITPIASLGATDQHSQNQLYFEGPNDKFFIFFEVGSFQNVVKIPLPDSNDSRYSYLKDADFGKLLNLEKAGTAGALSQVDRPHITIKLPQIDEENIGEIFMLFEGATAFLGEFLGINAFDQPGVELSKNITKELLLKS